MDQRRRHREIQCRSARQLAERFARLSWSDQRPAEEEKKDRAENLKRLDDAFEAAKAYYLAKKANPNVKVDERWEAMLPVFSKELTVFVNADDVRQITQAVDFAKKWDIKIVIVNGRDAYKVADLLKANDIPVVYGRRAGITDARG